MGSTSCTYRSVKPVRLVEAKAILDTAGLPTGDEVVAEAIEHLRDGPVFVPIATNRRFFERVTALDRRSAAETMARLAYRAIGKPTTVR